MKEHSWFDQNKHGFVLKRLHLEPKASSNNLIYPSMHVLMFLQLFKAADAIKPDWIPIRTFILGSNECIWREQLFFC